MNEKIIKSNKQINSYNTVIKMAKQASESSEQNDENKLFVYDETVTVQDEQTFYYNYDNEEYYFTAKNAKFQIDNKGFITWYSGQWLDGFFRNGLWIDGTWHKGTFCRGNWLDGKWMSGDWFKGEINGTPSEVHP